MGYMCGRGEGDEAGRGMRLYLFPHPDVGISIGVLARDRDEALEVLKEQRRDVHFIIQLYGIEPSVIDKPSVLYVEGVHNGR